MPNPDPYIRKSSAVGIDLPPRGATDKKRWRTSEDAKRVKEYDTFENLYLGNHNKKAGGPFKHPYGMKAVDEDIPYKIFNLLGKGSEAFANLVVGDGVFASSADENTQALLQILDFSLPLWEAMVRSSALGFVGLQPMQITKNQIPVQIRKEIDISSLPDKLWNWGIVDPRFLYLEFGPVDREIVKIRKALPFRNIKINRNKQIDILFEETHTKDRIETRLYQISGEFIEQELDLAIYKLIDPEAQLVETWEHNLNNFFISLLINNKLETKILSDYTLPAVRAQEALNKRTTQIARILCFHSNPKLMAPRSAASQNRHGDWVWTMDPSGEVLFTGPEAGGDSYRYLTWDGQLQEARSDRDHQICNILTEFDLAPHFISYPGLVNSTSADTAAKLEKMSHATIKRAGRKKRWLEDALSMLIANILFLSGKANSDFSINTPEFITPSRTEVLGEVTVRKQNALITTKKALMMLDNLSEEEAEKEVAEIHNENNSATVNPFNDGFTRRNFGVVPDEDDFQDDVDDTAEDINASV